MIRRYTIGLLGAAFCIGLAVSSGGCASADSSSSTGENVGTQRSNIFGGTAAPEHNEVTRLLGSVDFVTDRFSATLLAPTLAVTTLQAVAKTQAFGSGGDQEGAGGTVCGAVGTFYDVSNITLLEFNPDGTTTTLKVSQIIANGQTDTCDGNLAFLVLSQPVTNVTFPKIVLDNKVPNVGDPTTACGTGITANSCALANGPQCITGSVVIPNGGAYAPANANYPAGIMITSNNVCGDDPGSPIYDANGGMIGLLAANFETDSTVHPVFPNLCYCDATEVAISTLLSSQPDFVARAFAVVGSTPWREGHQQPAAVGGTCTDALDCNSQFCVDVGDQGYCSQDCESSACPAATTCTVVGQRSVCLPEVKPAPASCSVSMSEVGNHQYRASTASVLACIAGLALVRRRRRSQRGKK